MEKDKKIMKYVPLSKKDSIRSAWKDDDGLWIMLNEGWITGAGLYMKTL